MKHPVLFYFVVQALSRRLVAGQTYRVGYRARFQWARDTSCQGTGPVLRVFCRGELQQPAEASESVACRGVAPTDAERRALTESALPGTEPSFFATGLECSSTCGDDPPCDQVYDEEGFYPFYRGTFGDIFFQCQGDDIEDVEAAFAYEEGAAGFCRGGILNKGWNLHAAQLGVLCGDEIRHDDYYVACASGYAYYDSDTQILAQPSLTTAIDFGEQVHYTCVSGDFCGTSDCTVDFEKVVVQTKLGNLIQSPECIETTLPTIEQVDTPSSPPAPRGLYTTRFQVRWDLIKDRSFGNADFERFTIAVTCLDAGVIELMEAFPNSVVCSAVDNSSLECQDDGDGNSRGGTDEAIPRGVTYTCTLPDAIPQTRAEYLEQNVERSARNSIFLWKVLYLGAFCGSAFTGEYISGDKVGECAFGNNWGVSPRIYGSDTYYCYSFLELDNTEFPGSVFGSLPAVVVSTDIYTWFLFATSMECFDFEAAPTISPAPSDERSPAPTSLPSAWPTSTPTQGPSPIPSAAPSPFPSETAKTQSPTLRPSTLPAGTPTQRPSPPSTVVPSFLTAPSPTPPKTIEATATMTPSDQPTEFIDGGETRSMATSPGKIVFLPVAVAFTTVFLLMMVLL